MSEDDKGSEGQGGQKIKVTVDDSPKVQRLMEEMNKIKHEKETKEAELKIALADKDKTTTERDELKADLDALAQSEFDSKKAELMKLAKEQKDVIGEDKIKEIDERIKTPEDLERTTFMLKSLEESRKLARESIMKELEDKGITFDKLNEGQPQTGEKPKPSGVVSLQPRKTGDLFSKPFDTPQEMVGELFRAERVSHDKYDRDPSEVNFEEYKKYKDALDGLFSKYVQGERNRYKTGGHTRWEQTGKGNE